MSDKPEVDEKAAGDLLPRLYGFANNTLLILKERMSLWGWPMPLQAMVYRAIERGAAKMAAEAEAKASAETAGTPPAPRSADNG